MEGELGQLVETSRDRHIEEPWRAAWELERGALKAHFKRKFRLGAVRPPEHLAQVSSLHLDRIPVKAYGSLRELAEAPSSPP